MGKNRAGQKPLEGKKIKVFFPRPYGLQEFPFNFFVKIQQMLLGIHYRKTNIFKRLIFGIKTNKSMLYCPWVLVAVETHSLVFTLKYQYFENFYGETLFKMCVKCCVRILLVQPLLGSITMCDNPVMLPSNCQTSDILTEHIVGKVVANFILNNIPSKKFSKYGYFSVKT